MNPPEPERKEPMGRGWRICWAVLIGILLFAVWGVAGVLRVSSGTELLRKATLEVVEDGCEKKIAFRVGRLTTGMARVVSGFFDLNPEARAAIAAVRGADVSIHKLHRRTSAAMQAEILARSERVMREAGWERVVAVMDRDEMVIIYADLRSGSVPLHCCFVVVNQRDLVVGSIVADVDPLIALAQSKLQLSERLKWISAPADSAALSTDSFVKNL